MSLYDGLIAILADFDRPLAPDDRARAAAAISRLQEIVRDYNPDDAIFDGTRARKITEDDAGRVMEELDRQTPSPGGRFNS